MANQGKLTAAVIGAGAIGQQHLRVLGEMPEVGLIAAVDPSPEAIERLRSKGVAAHGSLDELMAAAKPDFAIVANPTESHAETALALIAEGIDLLIEKPIAATSKEASAIVAAAEEANVRAAVGHIERFNPATAALRERLLAGELGEVFAISTERVGPFPARIRDVGVAKDLATHDLDLIAWVGGSPITALAARTAHRTGRAHEDLVMMTGELGRGVPFNSIVDWLTPVKRRTVKVLGQAGMFLADTVTSDLHFYENGVKQSEWELTRTLRGVSEGNVTRFALERREPLRAELEAFCDYLATGDPANTVTLTDGADALMWAERAVASSTEPLMGQIERR